MRKLLTVAITLLAFTSCISIDKPTPGKIYNENTSYSIFENLRYFKDEKTKNCFVERGTYDSYSFACVKCDSLFEAAYQNQFIKLK